MTKAQERREEIEANKRTAYVARVQRLLGHLIGQRLDKAAALTAYAAGTDADAYAAHVAAQEPVGAAVHALKADAVKDAAERARKTIERVKTELAAGGWLINTVAPYPMHGYGHDARMAKAKYSLFHSLTTEDEAATRAWHDAAPTDGEARLAYYRKGNPGTVKMSDRGAERFIANAEASAAAEYDAFICKLVFKTSEGSPVTTATLEGSHVWSSSILTITRADGSSERWSTKQIWNVSKLGNEFPQWPSRKVK